MNAQINKWLAGIAAITLLQPLSGCVSHESAMQKNQKQFVGQYPEIVTTPFTISESRASEQKDKFNTQFDTGELFRLTPEQKKQFIDWYHDPRRADIRPHKRLYEYLEQYTYGFDFRGETLTASVALENKSGNCLSLALMTTALAKIASIEVGYQKINAAPVYKKENGVLTLSHHVRTYLYDPTWQPAENVMTFIRPRLVVDYFPSRYDVPGESVSEPQFMGMYYRNLSVDALLKGEIKNAFWLAYQALQLSANDAENINLMAIIYRRAGLTENAEAFYQYGMQNARNNTNLLSNYALLLGSANRHEEAYVLRQKLLDYPDSNPYSWLKLGHEAYQQNNNLMAIRYYNKALKLAPYLDEIYFGLAKSLYKEREYGKAAIAMKTAAEKSWEKSERELYYAKLSALRARQFE